MPSQVLRIMTAFAFSYLHGKWCGPHSPSLSPVVLSWLLVSRPQFLLLWLFKCGFTASALRGGMSKKASWLPGTVAAPWPCDWLHFRWSLFNSVFRFSVSSVSILLSYTLCKRRVYTYTYTYILYISNILFLKTKCCSQCSSHVKK